MQSALLAGSSTRADPLRRDADPQAGWALLDDPAEWPAFGRPLDDDAAGGRWESHVAIEGMHCAACAFTVEAALAQVPGVLEVDVNAVTRRARVLWSAAAVKPSRWFGACAGAGYRLVPASDTAVRARRSHEARLALWRWSGPARRVCARYSTSHRVLNLSWWTESRFSRSSPISCAMPSRR